jgi:hypothetical protein
MRHAPTIRSDRPRLGTFTFILYIHIMKLLLFLVFIFFRTFCFGQACTPGSAPTDIFYPNSTSVPSTNNGPRYLCGPNTVVYDTLNLGCRFVYVSAGSTLVLNNSSPICGGTGWIFLKSNSTLILLPNAMPAGIITESSTTIVNQTGQIISPASCSLITFPAVNCSTGLSNLTSGSSAFLIWPTPCSTKVNFDFSNFTDKYADISFVNQFGQSVKTFRQFSLDRNEIPIDDLPNGSYL